MNRLEITALERQQMLDRERAVVQNLHDRKLCLSGCLICKENLEKNLEATAKDAETEGDRRMAHILRTLVERGSQYGDYDHMARVAQTLKNVLEMAPNYAMTNYVQRESLDVIATKLARIVCGDPNHRDSWHDIQGYAKLVEDRLPVNPAADAPATDSETP